MFANGTAAGTSKVNALSLAGSPNNWSASLDLTNNKLVVQDAAAHNITLATLQNQVTFGLTHSAGISSSALSANTALAVLDNAVTNFTTFGGQPVDANALLIAPELLGDANADGKVDLADLNTVLQNFGTTTPALTSGNFDYAATIDLTDLSYVLNNFGLTNPGASTSGAGNSNPTPEPASFALLSISFLLANNRRSKRAR
jgi:hypothetical protein